MVTCIIKVLLSVSYAAITNSFKLTSWTCLVVSRALLVVYNFHVSIFSPNAMSALLIFRKDISRITSNLVLATRKVFWKNLGLPPLDSVWKSVISIPKVSKVKPSIFWALTLVFQIWRPSFRAKAGLMALILLPLLSKAFSYFWPSCP